VTAEIADLSDLLDRNATARPDHPAISWFEGDVLRTLSWSDYRAKVRLIAHAYVDLGLKPDDTVAILAPNIAEHFIADLAALQVGAATVSLYPTLSADQLAYVLRDADPKVIVVADVAAHDRVVAALQGRQSAAIVVVIDAGSAVLPSGAKSWIDLIDRAGDASEKRVGGRSEREFESDPGRVATYVYTSGTTGNPKGVILTHGNLLYQLGAWERTGLFQASYRVVSYLPLSHIAERLWSLYFPLQSGGHVLCCPDSSQLVRHLAAQRPSFFMGVPRVWEKLRAGARSLLGSPKYSAREDELKAAMAVTREAWTASQDDRTVSAELTRRAIAAREGILFDVHKDLGFDQTVTSASGAAPISHDLKEFFGSLGIDICQAYGLSETTGLATWERVGWGSRGSSGFALPGSEVRIADDGEIMLRSPGLTPGYRNMPEATEALFVDGWLASGDIGRLDEAGRLFVTDRKKELIVTSSGKNISPTSVESLLVGRDIIDQVVVVGDGKPYLTALLTASPTNLLRFAKDHGLPETDLSSLVRDPLVLAHAQCLVDRANESLSRPERIKKFELLADQWSDQTGELTPSMKLRRRVITTKYAHTLDRFYSQQPSPTEKGADDV